MTFPPRDRGASPDRVVTRQCVMWVKTALPRRLETNRPPYQAPPSIFRKSSCPFAGALSVLGPEGTGLLVFAATTLRVFLLPSPALGREAADRGMKRPPVAAGGGPDGRAVRAAGADFSRVSSESCSVCPLKIIGSACKSNFPASYGGH